jgi:hypothetical protein
LECTFLRRNNFKKIYWSLPKWNIVQNNYLELQGWFLLYFSSANFFIFCFLFHSSISNLKFSWDFVLVWIIDLFELLGLLLRGIYHPSELFEIEFEAI